MKDYKTLTTEKTPHRFLLKNISILFRLTYKNDEHIANKTDKANVLE